MIVLALDSTTPAGSVGLDVGAGVPDVHAGDASRGWSERLPGDLLALLSARGLTPQNVDLFAVVAGPGSLTGMRVGIATMQGLAFATGKPIVAVSALDALADHLFHEPGRQSRAPAPGPDDCVAAWTNAMRGEVFAALYRHRLDMSPAEDEAPIDGPFVDAPAAAAARLAEQLGGRRVTIVGDVEDTLVQPLRTLLESRATFVARPLLAQAVLRMATRQAARGMALSPHAVRPLYVRKPDVVITRERAAVRPTPAPSPHGR